MNKIFFLLSTILIISGACKSKKSSAGTSENKQLAAVRTVIPETTADDLQKGKLIFNGPCTKCHSPKNLSPYKKDQLKGIIDKMAVKANLTQQEKDAVWKYALALNLTK